MESKLGRHRDQIYYLMGFLDDDHLRALLEEIEPEAMAKLPPDYPEERVLNTLKQIREGRAFYALHNSIPDDGLYSMAWELVRDAMRAIPGHMQCFPARTGIEDLTKNAIAIVREFQKSYTEEKVATHDN